MARTISASVADEPSDSIPAGAIVRIKYKDTHTLKDGSSFHTYWVDYGYSCGWSMPASCLADFKA